MESIYFIIGFVFVIIAAYFTTKLIGARAVQFSQGKYMKIIDRIMIGNNKWILLIQVGTRYYLIGTTHNNIELLGRVREAELVPLNYKEKTHFYNLLGSYLGNKLKLNDENSVIKTILESVKRRRDILKNFSTKSRDDGVRDNGKEDI